MSREELIASAGLAMGLAVGAAFRVYQALSLGERALFFGPPMPGHTAERAAMARMLRLFADHVEA